MMYPQLEQEIQRQEEELAMRARRVPVPLYPTVLRTDEEKQKDVDRKGNSDVRRGEATTPVLDLESWPRGKDVLACNRHMLENQLACDVWFNIGEGGGNDGQTVGAHAYVLRSRSSAFYVKLSKERRRGRNEEEEKEEGGERENIIPLPPNTSAKVLWQLLRYLYYEDLKLEADSAMELLELANTYDVITLRDACLRFLRGSLAVGTACAVLEKAHKYDDLPLTEACLRFVRQHGSDVIRSSGVAQLCRECLNRVLTLDGLELTPTLRQEAADRWTSHRCQDDDNDNDPTTTKAKAHTGKRKDPLGDVLYVKKDTQQSRCYFSDSLTDKRRFDKHQLHKRTPEISPFTAGSQLHQVTRFPKLHGSVTNHGSADAIAFSVDCPIYLYGFGIYGSPDNTQETSYRVDTVLSRKKNDLALETISIRGVGTILPVMLSKPVKLKEEKKHTLAVYVHGPPSQCGASGRVRVRGEGQVVVTFYPAPRDVKGNRTDVPTGQIPRLYYLPC